MVCGHTHGGQIAPPVLGPVFNASRAPLRWTHGHIEEGGRHLFVSTGFGTSSLPLRWRRPPEVNVLTVTGKKKDPQVCGDSRAKWLG